MKNRLILGGLILLMGGLFADEAPHVVLVCGPPHYSPNVSMGKMKEYLEELGFKATYVGIEKGSAERKKDAVLPGIEALKDADLAIFFMRWLTVPDEEWQLIEGYLKSGKPVMGFRTANHAFKYAEDHPRYEWNDGFGRRVFGTPYVVHQKGSTKVMPYKQAGKHPILSGVEIKDWVSPGTLYLARMEPGVKPLLLGEGKGGVRILEKDYGVEVASSLEVDAVAWTWENEWGGKVFFTSMGHLGDFKVPAFNRLWVNAVYWSLGRAVLGENYEAPSWEFGHGKGGH